MPLEGFNEDDAPAFASYLVDAEERAKTHLAKHCVGERNAIPAKDLKDVAWISVVEGARPRSLTLPELRTIIRHLRDNGCAVCSNRFGYFMPTSATELQQTIHHIAQRKRAHEKTEKALRKTYSELGFGEVPEGL